MLRIFSPPLIEDPERNRVASNVSSIILGFMAFIVVTFGIAVFMQRQFMYRYLLIILIVCVVSATFLFFLKKGHVKPIAYMYITFLLLMIIGFSWTGGGIKGHGIKLLPVVVLFAGLTIGRKEIWLFGIIASLGAFSLVAADHFHILPIREPLGDSDLIYWIYSTACIFLFCHLEYLSVGGLNKALDEAKTELTLRKKSEEKYRRIFESFQDIYYQTDMDGNIIIITPSIKMQMGYDPSEVIGRKVSDFYLHPESKDSLLSELTSNGSVRNYEIDILAKNRNIIHAILSSHIIYDINGKPRAIEGTIHDITQLKNAEDILKLKNKNLLEIAFLQSHIVRRPVASIIGLISLIDTGNPAAAVNFEVIPKLEIAAKELDDVIKQIVEKTTEIKQNE